MFSGPETLYGCGSARSSAPTPKVSDLAPEPYGSLLVVLDKREPLDTAKFDAAKPLLESRTLQNKTQVVFFEWLQERRREADPDRDPPPSRSQLVHSNIRSGMKFRFSLLVLGTKAPTKNSTIFHKRKRERVRSHAEAAADAAGENEKKIADRIRQMRFPLHVGSMIERPVRASRKLDDGASAIR